MGGSSTGGREGREGREGKGDRNTDDATID